MKTYSETSVRLLLALACRKAGGQKAFAGQHKISAPYINDVILGRRMPGKKILAALKLVRVVMYERMEE